ncbi:MAG: hypothetical protein ABL907_24890 [Hyphomicrobium sp.]
MTSTINFANTVRAQDEHSKEAAQPGILELSEAELDAVAGGAYRFVRAIAISGNGTTTNPQLWVTTST